MATILCLLLLLDYICFCKSYSCSNPTITGIRVIQNPLTSEEIQVEAEESFTLWIFGSCLKSVKGISFSKGRSCKSRTKNFSKLQTYSNTSIKIENIVLPQSKDNFKVCMWTVSRNATFVSPEKFNEIQSSVRRSHILYMEMYIQIPLIVMMVLMSGLFSGLNVGLIALDTTELEILAQHGDDKEKSYATKILPVRNQGNFLLCGILLGNTLVNTVIAILIDNLVEATLGKVDSKYVVVVLSTITPTMAIVIFGEIIPQSICVHNGLAVGARTIFFTYAVLIITAPVAYPLGKLLDCVVGKQIGRVYAVQRVLQLMKMTIEKAEGKSQAEEDIRILSGAIKYRGKIVSEIMTPIDKIFMLEAHERLDMKKLERILESGFTRIPVYKNERNNVVMSLNVKDLAILDPNKNFTVGMMCRKHPTVPLRFVMESTPTKVMLGEFKQGKYHFVMVQKVEYIRHTQEIRYEVTGLLSLEDIIEEILGAEITDETDPEHASLRRKHIRNFSLTEEDEAEGENSRSLMKKTLE